MLKRIPKFRLRKHRKALTFFLSLGLLLLAGGWYGLPWLVPLPDGLCLVYDTT